jgi:putative aldouronate transport system substrate-binding protein
MMQAGLLSSYNDLIDEYDPSFWDIMRMDIFNWYQESDGQTYGIPNFGYSSASMTPGERLDPNRAFTLRSDLLDRIGRPGSYTADGYLDVTADEFLDILEQVKDLGEYDGLPIIPLQLYEFSDRISESVGRIAQYFSTPFEDPSGDWAWVAEQENYFQAIAFLNEAFNRRLLSPETFTDTREQVNQKVASGRAFALFTAPQDFIQQFTALHGTDEDAKFEGFVLRNDDGDDPQLPDIAGFGWLTTSVAASASVPDRIIKLIHFLYSDEGQYATWFYDEGETYNFIDGGTGIDWTDKWNAMSADERNQTYGGDLFMFKDWLTVMNLMPESRIPMDERPYPDGGVLKIPGVPHSFDAKPVSLNTDPDDPRNDDMLTLNTEIDLFWGKEVPRMITASSVAEARAIWEATVEESYIMGMADLIDYNNDRFQRTKEKLGYEFAFPPNQR